MTDLQLLAMIIRAMEGERDAALQRALERSTALLARLETLVATERPDRPDWIHSRPVWPQRNPVSLPAKLLETLGQIVHTERSPLAALDYVIAERPEMVISDIGMPELNGYQLAHRIRQLPELSGVTLVALTGYGQESDKVRAHEAGFDYHIVKPVSMNALQDLLVNAVVPSVQHHLLPS